MSGDDIEMDLNQIENELIVQLSDSHQGVPATQAPNSQLHQQLQQQAVQPRVNVLPSNLSQGYPASAMNFAPQNPGMNPPAGRPNQQ